MKLFKLNWFSKPSLALPAEDRDRQLRREMLRRQQKRAAGLAKAEKKLNAIYPRFIPGAEIRDGDAGDHDDRPAG
jgi:hypothetical protein